MLNETDISALTISLKLAFFTTAILLVIGTPLSLWLARSRNRFKPIIEALVALPLVLPPTVLGFYLLIALGPQGPLGSLISSLGGQAPAFSFSGLVIGSVFYSLPFVVQPLQSSFASIDPRILEAASTLRAKPLNRFFSITLPLARPGFISAAVLGFAHTLGEFGVVLMIGGNIPGQTQVVSIAIYDHVEAMDYAHAHNLSGILLSFSFILLLGLYIYNRKLSAPSR